MNKPSVLFCRVDTCIVIILLLQKKVMVLCFLLCFVTTTKTLDWFFSNVDTVVYF